HTRSKRDWSSDVCSSDLRVRLRGVASLEDTVIERRLLLVIHLAEAEAQCFIPCRVACSNRQVSADRVALLCLSRLLLSLLFLLCVLLLAIGLILYQEIGRASCRERVLVLVG